MVKLSDFVLGLDIGSYEIKANIAKFEDDNFTICGIGKAKTTGIKKGVITNIEQASKAIKKAVKEATKSSGTRYDKAIVSISGAYTKYTKSAGVINVPNEEIGLAEIRRAIQMAEHNASIPNDYAKLHILPYKFKVDEQDHIEDPLGMSGSRLEVGVHIVTAPKSSIKNLEKSVQMAGVEIDNIVLSGYASAIATLTKEEKELGVCVIDMGASTCDMVVHIGNSLVHNDVLLIGSSNITNDLSKALHTPLAQAENVKTSYSKLIDANCKNVELSTLGNENKKTNVSMDIITNIIYARIEETLMILLAQLEKSKFIDKLGAGIVLTGGMAKLDDIRALTAAIFNNLPVRVATPRQADGLYEISSNPANSCVIGLCLYGAGEFTPYEIDSNAELRYKNEVRKLDCENELLANKENSQNEQNYNNLVIEENNDQKSGGNFITKIINSIINKIKESF